MQNNDNIHYQNYASPFILVRRNPYYLGRLFRSVYARHGRRFKDPALQNYFNSLPWYSPTRDEVSVYELSETERHNVSVIQSME